MTVTGRVFGTLPAKDMNRAKAFYEKNLGIKPVMDNDDGAVYELAEHTKIMLFPSTGEPSGTHTQANFECDDLDAEVRRMKANGVKFEDYDTPGLKTKDSITVDQEFRGAWFHDSEGNLIAISERMPMM
ncbi:VOC family protein [Longispora albida]|uniref:VOC family protein n=1 Tax=Longispora albida TaxID=203523 RepID=UPI00036A633C|nr:VOC family protein [Longispora albida]